MSLKLHFLNGPNLNLLGEREPEIYGSSTLADLESIAREAADAEQATLTFLQTNHEGELVDWVQNARKNADALILNAAAYTHSSVALHDALKALTIPVVEVHLSNPSERESFRKRNFVSPCASGVIKGFGPLGYRLGVSAAAALARQRS